MWIKFTAVKAIFMFKIEDSLVSLRSLWRQPKALQEEGFSPVLLRHSFPRPGGNPGRSRRRGRWSREPSRCTGHVGCSSRCRLGRRRTIGKGFFSWNYLWENVLTVASWFSHVKAESGTHHHGAPPGRGLVLQQSNVRSWCLWFDLTAHPELYFMLVRQSNRDAIGKLSERGFFVYLRLNKQSMQWQFSSSFPWRP